MTYPVTRCAYVKIAVLEENVIFPNSVVLNYKYRRLGFVLDLRGSKSGSTRVLYRNGPRQASLRPQFPSRQ
jgi:hypothetical protein